MRIAFATDIHENPKIFPWLDMVAGRDIVAIGGDITNSGPSSLGFMDTFVSKGIRMVNLASVMGNHDWSARMTERGFLHGTTTTIKGTRIGGIGGSLPAGGCPFELDETEYQILLNRMGPCDVLLTHQPPYNTKCDVAMGGGFFPRHIGSKAIRRYIELRQPRLGLVGHVHESQGIDKIGNSVIVNAGAFAFGDYAEITIVGSHIHTEFRRLL